MPAGRPSKYVKRYAKEAAHLCGLGATTEQLAQFFSVTTSTIKLWAQHHTEFSAALRAKLSADEEVEQSLFKRAKGYDHLDKHYPPDTTAGIFWLKNRQPGKWRDKQEFGVTDVAGNDAQLVVSLGAQIAQQMRKK